MGMITPTPENIETLINRLQQELRSIDQDQEKDVTIRARELLQDIRKLAVDREAIERGDF
jgi:hypothetical protein